MGAEKGNCTSPHSPATESAVNASTLFSVETPFARASSTAPATVASGMAPRAPANEVA